MCISRTQAGCQCCVQPRIRANPGNNGVLTKQQHGRLSQGLEPPSQLTCNSHFLVLAWCYLAVSVFLLERRVPIPFQAQRLTPPRLSH
ncbi:hypothetical protein SKAU_G00311440 [Synaphobranchus kaupii]|uniref:Uncharacterized protein n=1 Tax=Synaphobranchus kaupii TaxID=118154 RepID=A0A9Q1ERR1_SYNKA|nr:hypothetical protein SKAU_G00311440 [Synaphobranchus kaupii]